MTQIAVKFTAQELELLRSLISDQLFRREFIDPKMPGYRANSGDLILGKQLASRLRESSDRMKGTAPKNGAAA